jgi:hypothetical protein
MLIRYAIFLFGARPAKALLLQQINYTTNLSERRRIYLHENMRRPLPNLIFSLSNLY